jgi:hypothetical protein
VGDRLDRLARIEPPCDSVWFLRLVNDGAEAWSNGSVSVAVVAVESRPFLAVLSLEWGDGCLISFPPLGGEDLQ